MNNNIRENIIIIINYELNIGRNLKHYNMFIEYAQQELNAPYFLREYLILIWF